MKIKKFKCSICDVLFVRNISLKPMKNMHKRRIKNIQGNL